MNAPTMTVHRIRTRARCRNVGAALVEFALATSIVFTLLIGIAEFGRLLFTWSAAVEATRWGARLAVVCVDPASPGDVQGVKSKMRLILPQLQDSNINIAFSPGACTKADCQSVSVGVTGVTLTTMIPFVSISLPIPAFSTSLPRESMSSTNNPVCI
jgi:Flp pilus assembly protein TadG